MAFFELRSAARKNPRAIVRLRNKPLIAFTWACNCPSTSDTKNVVNARVSAAACRNNSTQSSQSWQQTKLTMDRFEKLLLLLVSNTVNAGNLTFNRRIDRHAWQNIDFHGKIFAAGMLLVVDSNKGRRSAFWPRATIYTPKPPKLPYGTMVKNLRTESSLADAANTDTLGSANACLASAHLLCPKLYMRTQSNFKYAYELTLHVQRLV